MNSIKVSIIVPVFNAAKYISRCLQSVIDQSLRDIEIIVVNDGSTDESEKIIQFFANKDERILFIDGKNEGVSAARNKGIRQARGEYIGFVDADDWVEPIMYQKLYEKANTAGADLAICNVKLVEEKKDATVRLTLENQILDIAGNKETELINLMRFKYDFANWNKIYSTGIIRQSTILFDEQMCVYEDLLFNLCYFQFASKATVVNEALYNYNVHEASVMNLGNHDIVEEYNLLFDRFNKFCKIYGFALVLDVCNKELRRMFYYAVIPGISKKIQLKEPTTMKRAKFFYKELHKIKPGLFDYKKTELSGLQGLKKRLLMNRHFILFSLLKVIRFKKIA